MVENIKLSNNFFQEFLEDHELANPQPTLQILQSRQVEQNTICLRLRCSDGNFSYIQCALAASLAARVQEDGLNEPDRYPVITVLEYTGTNTNGKIAMLIKDYELIAIDAGKIGNPTAHTGDPETFRGISAAKRKLNETNPLESYSSATPKKLAKTDGSGGGPILPLSGISPFISGKWRICGVVSGKEELRTINSKKGPMKVFSFIVSDKDGQSIKITAFAETADKIYGQVEEGKRYFVSGTQNCIKPANKRFNSTGHDYEITLNNESQLEESEDQHYEAPKFLLKKTSLDQISTCAGHMVDILAVIDKIEEPAKVRTKANNSEVSRRNVHLIDQSSTSVSLTLWGEQADNFGAEEGRVMGIKGAYVREFNGTYSLSINHGTRLEIDPEGKDTEALLQWFESERPNAEVKSISSNGTSNGGGNFIEEARLFSVFSNSDVFLHHDRGIYFSSIAYVTSVRTENALYKSCPECSKKVIELDGGFYRCEKCYKSIKEFKYRYMVSMEITDVCGPTWVTIFDDKASTFFGKTATEMGELQTSNNDEYKAILNSKVFGCYNFRCRAKWEIFNDVHRSRIQVFDYRQPNFVQYGQALDELMERLEAI